MKVLVINCGSSSLKYQVFDMNTETVLAKGIAEKIGLDGSFLKYRRGDEENITIEAAMPNHEVAIKLVFDALVNPEYGVLENMSEIEAVGHRVVHAGEKFACSVVIDDQVMAALRECIDLAPLHNPPNIIGIEAATRLMPNVTHVGVFDTAFHQSMPDYAYLYALPYEYYGKYGLRRYGFHGTSHLYVSQRAAALLNKPAEQLKVITCHLGNGASITAVDGGRSVDTSMGFTPLEGLIMGTRSGDVDPAVVSFLAGKEGLTADDVVNKLLNKRSGVLGISGVSSDFRAIEEAAKQATSVLTWPWRCLPTGCVSILVPMRQRWVAWMPSCSPPVWARTRPACGRRSARGLSSWACRLIRRRTTCAVGKWMSAPTKLACEYC